MIVICFLVICIKSFDWISFFLRLETKKGDSLFVDCFWHLGNTGVLRNDFGHLGSRISGLYSNVVCFGVNLGLIAFGCCGCDILL